MKTLKLRSKALRALVDSAKDILKCQRIHWKNFQVVVLTLSSSKNNFILHWKIEKSQKIRFFKKFILDEFFIGWILTIKNENFRCCGMFLNWNSPWYILRIHFLIKSIFDIFQFLNCGFANFSGQNLIYPAGYRPIGYIFGKYTLSIPSHSKWSS